MKVRSRKEEATLRTVGLCRGEGLGYVAFGGNEPAEGPLSCTARADGTMVPSALYPVTSDAIRDALAPDLAYVWVVVVPLLASDCHIEVRQGERAVTTLSFPALRSKLSSRLLTLSKPHAAEALRGYERSHGWGVTRVRIAEVWPALRDRVVWRIRAAYPVENRDEHPRMRLFEERACEIPCEAHVMEDQVVPSARDASRRERIVTFSCVLPASVRTFYAVVDLGDAEGPLGFDGMNAPRAAAMLEDSQRLTEGTLADLSYASWFEAQRATEAELALQRAACADLPAERRPLISLVVTAGQASPDHVRRSIAAVRAQSYEQWELLVAHTREDAEQLYEYLAVLNDDRIHVVQAVGKNLADALNDAMAATCGAFVGFVDEGDVLEPDALWHMVQAANTHPEADLLYSDEDSKAGSVVHDPLLKPQPNYGKLYEYDFVGHLLMVSRRACAGTQRSESGVAAAYAYDLALKTFEVARDIVHVPRVLYHVCDEARSERKRDADAHEAGMRALAAHLERRGIVAQVQDGVLPQTYRVRYTLPDPAPLVSIVIPTRDQAELLRACVTSIREMSTYQNIELVLVENNSREPQTFALYEELKQADARVRVVTWEPEQSGTFNYSALVNFGVAHARGEYVVLLNNDTEVIAPTWIEEMLGCLMRPEVGVVGAKLLFKDGLIQHVGMVGNPDGFFCHVCQNLNAEALGPGRAAAMPGDCAMVTGACQMVRRALYEELGGYDEDLAVGFNDGDFCLRAREAGHVVTLCARALLYHREFSSRGRESTDARLRSRFLQEKARNMGKHASYFAQGDPVMNPNLDPFGAYFTLQR